MAALHFYLTASVCCQLQVPCFEVGVALAALCVDLSTDVSIILPSHTAQSAGRATLPSGTSSEPQPCFRFRAALAPFRFPRGWLKQALKGAEKTSPQKLCLSPVMPATETSK